MGENKPPPGKETGLFKERLSMSSLAANPEHGRAAFFTNSFPGGLAVLHGYFLNILSVSLGAALNTIKICHRLFSPPLSSPPGRRA